MSNVAALPIIVAILQFLTLVAFTLLIVGAALSARFLYQLFKDTWKGDWRTREMLKFCIIVQVIVGITGAWVLFASILELIAKYTG